VVSAISLIRYKVLSLTHPKHPSTLTIKSSAGVMMLGSARKASEAVDAVISMIGMFGRLRAVGECECEWVENDLSELYQYEWGLYISVLG